MIKPNNEKPEYLSREGKQSNCGWLVRTDRRKRRDDPNTMIDKDVEVLISKIRTSINYSAPHVTDDVTQLIKQRDTAMIALFYTFFKRGSENLSLKLKEISFDNHKIYIKYKVKKKIKHYRICPTCEEINAQASIFCKNCGIDISKTPITEKRNAGDTEYKNKTKSVKYPFVKYIIIWVQTMRSNTIPLVTSESWLFPSYSFFSNCWNVNIEKHLSIARFNQILQKLDPSLSSHLFRYGKTENLLRAGYSKSEVSNIGDWSGEKIVEIYAKRKNITSEELRFSEDLSV